MNRHLTRALQAAPLLAAPLLIAACSGSDGSSSTSDGTMGALLQRLPAEVTEAAQTQGATSTEITLGDYAAASELAGLEVPDPSDVDASLRWLVELTAGNTIEDGGTGFAAIPPSFPSVTGVGFADEIEAELGFSPFAIETYSSFIAFPIQFAVVADDLSLSGDLTDLGDGVVTAGEGEDYSTDVASRTSARPLGQPLRLAATDGVVAASTSTPLVEAWVAGDGSNPFDDPSLTSAADALDTADSVSAYLVATDFTAVPILDAEEVGIDVPTGISVPFTTVGIGTTAVDGRAASAIAYVFADESSAESALPEIDTGWQNNSLGASGQPISELYDVRAVEQIGATVLVTATVTDAGSTRVALDMMFQRDPLFGHA